MLRVVVIVLNGPKHWSPVFEIPSFWNCWLSGLVMLKVVVVVVGIVVAIVVVIVVLVVTVVIVVLKRIKAPYKSLQVD